MSGYKEFEGKTLDEAIRDACVYYDATRDKLEIEILNDAKAGIFGLVGAKKARVRAKLVEFSSVLEGLDSLEDKGKQSNKRHDAPFGGSRHNDKREARGEASRKERSSKSAHSAHEEMTAAEAAVPEAASHVESNEEAEPMRSQGRAGAKLARAPRREHSASGGGQRRAKREYSPEEGNSEQNTGTPLDAGIADIDADGEEFSRVPFDQLDAAALENAAREIVSRLTAPFLGEAAISVSIDNDRVRLSLNDIEDPALLIGRDGQTLASLQYLVTRMLSNRMKALLRVQIDAGDYRERQDERLRDMALSLAAKVKDSGRPQVTRPLSSYHRRLIHLTLQDDPQIQTHSKGEGEMKRVMVARRKG